MWEILTKMPKNDGRWATDTLKMAGCCNSSELIPLTRSIVKCKVIRDELMQFLLSKYSLIVPSWLTDEKTAEHNEENLEFLIEVQVYKTRLLPCTRAYHGRKIVDKFIKTGSEKELNISS